MNKIEDDRKFHTLAYTQTKIINMPVQSDLYKKQLLNRYNQKDKKKMSNRLSKVSNQIQKQLGILFNQHKNENKVSEENLKSIQNESQSSKYVTIAFDIKKNASKSLNLENEAALNESNHKILQLMQTNLLGSSICDCEISEKDIDEEFLMIPLNANAYELSLKVFLCLSTTIIIGIIGIMTSLYFLQIILRSNERYLKNE
jgi:hypothetical protein